MPSQKPFSNILCPTDFSACSREALRMAVELARRFEAKLTLLHVYQIPVYAVPESALYALQDLNSAFVKRASDEMIGARRDVPPDVRCDAVLVEGAPFVEILRVAREGKYDLIVTGTHGRTGIRHVLLGSVAERVVRGAPCPVLTVRESESARSSSPER